MRSLWLIMTLIVPQMAAQTQSELSRAAATITAGDLMRHITVIAADSMQGRATPSPGLEQTAAYVAAEFERLGLKPAGSNGGYIQRFAVTRWRTDSGRSSVALRTSGMQAAAQVGVDARYVLGRIPAERIRGPVLLIAGLDTAAAVADLNVKDRIVLLLADFAAPIRPALNQKILDLARGGPTAVLVLSNRDSALFAERLLRAERPRLERDSEYEAEPGAPVIELHERRLGPLLRAAGINPGQLRKVDSMQSRLVPGLAIEIRLVRSVLDRAEVPNVVAVMEGSDSLLRREYVAYSAHLDHIGVTSGKADSVNNGADDNASGVAGLLELAQAFSRPGPRPRRSILFLAPSAEEDGLLGSAHFTEHPTVPLTQIVADLNTDLIGRNWPDSVIAVGLEQSDLGQTLEVVSRKHPELRMAPMADRWPEERIFYRSDHYNFARKGVPVLFFTSGTHADYHQPGDDPSRIDAEKEARVVRLLYYLGVQVANTTSRPRWNPESYRQIVDRN